MEKLQNKDVRTLHNELKTEHTKHTEGMYYNGELREAAKAVADKTLTALEQQGQKILDSDCDGATKTKLNAKRVWIVKEIINYTDPIRNTEYLFSHDKHLNQLAQRIDNAENEIASMIEDIWRKQELQATKESIGSKYFKELPKWWLQLTAATNAPRIDKVLGKLIQPNKVWKIDYSGCTNEKFKNMMIEAMGWLSSGFISQGIDSQWNNTFVIKGLDWKQINQRAIIREWVTLYPSEAIVDESIKQQNNKTNQLKNVDTWKVSKLRIELSKHTWLSNALWEKKDAFIKIAEEKLHNTIVYAKTHGWELHSEPITKKRLTQWQLLQAHLINDTWEIDFWLLTKPMDSEIYEILDDNEWDLVQYMTARIKQKWNEYGHLDKVNTVAVWKQEKWKSSPTLDILQKDQVKSGLQWLTTMVQNFIDAEGDTKLWIRDEKLRALSSYLRDITFAVNTGKDLTQYDIDTFSGKIAQLYRLAFDLSDTYTSRDWIQTQNYDSKKDVKTILLWKPHEVADAMRTLWERSTYGSNTNTSFLADDIANNVEHVGWTDKNGDWKITDDEKDTRSTMKIEKSTYNDCFQRIETLLWSNKPWSKEKIDEMYAIWSAQDLFTWFVNNWLLPKNAEFKNPLMRDGWPKSRTEAIFNQLKATEKQIENVDAITENARKGRAEEKRALESKWMLSDNEMQQLQVLHVLELHPDKANEAVQGILTSMKYEWAANLVRGQLTPWLVKEWGWVEWKNADTYNDIVWAWWWLDFSDANAVTAQWMVVMMVEEIWSIVLAWVLIASVGWAPAGLWILATKFAQWWKRIDRFVDAISELKYIAKLWKLMDKTALTSWIKNVWKGMVKSQTLATAWLAQGMLASERSIKDWWIDHQIDAFTLWMVQKLGMISVLQAVTTSATTGTLAKWFSTMSDWKLKVAKQISAQVFFEEIWMAGTDFTSSLMLSNQPFTLKELADNLLLGVVFEAIPWVKKVIVNPKGVNVDGKVFTNQQAKTELENRTANPDVKKAVEAKMKQYESKSPQNNRKKYQEALERDNAEISRIRREIALFKKELSEHTAREKSISWENIKWYMIWDQVETKKGKKWEVVWFNVVNQTLLIKRDAKKTLVSPEWFNPDFFLPINQKLKDAERKLIIKIKADIEARILRNEATLKHLEERSLRMHEKVIMPEEKIKDRKEVFTDKKTRIWQNIQKIHKESLETWKNLVRGMWALKLSPAFQRFVSEPLEWLTRNDIIVLQKELWLTGKEVDGVFWPKTLKKLEAYLNDRSEIKITAQDLEITKQIVREIALKDWIGNQKVFFAEAKANGGKITVDGIVYLVDPKKWVATKWGGGWNNPLINEQLWSLFEKYQNQKVEEFVNNHPDVKNAKIIDEAVENNKESIPKVEQSISSSEKQITEISIEGLTIPTAVASYFKNNPIPESVAKKLTPEDIWIIENYLTHEMHANWAIDKKTKMVLKKREQLVEVYIRDIVAKRVDTPVRVESKQNQEAKAWEAVKAVEASWSQNPFDFAKSADAIAAQAFKEIPANATLAKSRVEQFGEWLWKNAVWPSLKFMTDAINWLKNIEFKFPSLKNQIAKISNNLESMRIKRSVEKIITIQSKSLQEKVDFVEKFDLENASNQELIALYKMTGWKWDPNKWDISELKDWKETVKTHLKLHIIDHLNTMRLEIKNQIPRIEHDFIKSPELKLSNQEVMFNLKEIEEYSLLLGNSEYVISKSEWKIFIEDKWDLDGIWLEIMPGKEYIIWRDHTELTKKIVDNKVSREHMSIKVDNKGNVIVRDLKSTHKTVLTKINNISQETKNILFQKYWMETNNYGPWTFFNRWKNQYQSYMGEDVNVFKKELLSEDIKSDFKIFLHPKPEFFNEVIEKMMLALKDEKNVLWKLSSNWPWLNVKNPQILLYIKWNQNEVNRIMQLLHKQLQSIEKQASFPRKRTDKWSFVSDDNAPSFLTPFKWGVKDWEPQWLIWYGQWEWWLKRNIAESGNADFYLYWENNAFIKETSIKKKNANETWLYKTVDQYNYNDRDILNKINNTESVEWKITNAARTHRTWIDELEKILDSNLLGSNEDRGIQFWWGLWSWYWDITIIMKDEVSQVWRPASVTHWSVSADNPRIHYFHWSAQQEWMAWSDYKNKIDFARNKWTKAQSDVPYLSIWWKNTDVNSDLENQVSANLIQAVMLPSHVKNYPWYKNILWKLKQKWIDVIHVDTQPSILDYSWSSIIDAVTRNRKSKINKMIIQELNVKYPSLNNVEDKVKQYLIDTKRIDTKDKWKSLQEIRNEYFNSFALNNWISRGSDRGWQYENYWSYANYNIEEKAYFWYMLFLKNNPQSKWNEFDQSMLLWGKVDQNNLNHTVLFRN